jgi:hypothetical protein
MKSTPNAPTLPLQHDGNNPLVARESIQGKRVSTIANSDRDISPVEGEERVGSCVCQGKRRIEIDFFSQFLFLLKREDRL